MMSAIQIVKRLLTGTLPRAQGVTAASLTTSAYYVADSELRSIGFEATDFILTARPLQRMDPNWSAMSFVFSAGAKFPDPGTIAPLTLGLGGLAAAPRSVKRSGGLRAVAAPLRRAAAGAEATRSADSWSASTVGQVWVDGMSARARASGLERSIS